MVRILLGNNAFMFSSVFGLSHAFCCRFFKLVPVTGYWYLCLIPSLAVALVAVSRSAERGRGIVVIMGCEVFISLPIFWMSSFLLWCVYIVG